MLGTCPAMAMSDKVEVVFPSVLRTSNCRRPRHLKAWEKNPRTKGWKMKCLYCTPDTVVEQISQVERKRLTEYENLKELLPNPNS